MTLRDKIYLAAIKLLSSKYKSGTKDPNAETRVSIAVGGGGRNPYDKDGN